MKVIETRPREIGFVLWGHCQNLLDAPRIMMMRQIRVCTVWLQNFLLEIRINDFLRDDFMLTKKHHPKHLKFEIDMSN